MATYGYLTDTVDDRDLIFTGARSTLTSPVRAAYLPVTSPVTSQGNAGTCVAFATAGAFQLLAGRSGVISVVSTHAAALGFLHDEIRDPILISELHLYFGSRLLHGGECEDGGTYPRCALRVANKQGMCRQSSWPYDLSKINVRPPLNVLSEAYNHRIDKYERILRSDAETMGRMVREAIDAGFPVIHGKDVGRDYLDVRGAPDSTVIGPPDIIEGGHATVIVGYRLNDDGSFHYLDRNSHGTRFGLASMPGHIYITEEYLGTARDLWVPQIAWEPSEI